MRHTTIGRRIAIAFAVTVASLFGLETANARRFFGRLRCAPCPPVVYCAPVCPPVYCGGYVVGDVVMDSQYPMESYPGTSPREDTPPPPPEVWEGSLPRDRESSADQAEDTRPDVDTQDSAQDPPPPPFEIPTEPDADAIPEPQEPEADDTDELPSLDDADQDDNLDDLFGDPLPETDDALPDVEPPTDQPADAIEPPADEEDSPLDELFGEDVDSEPTDADIDDLFDTPAEQPEDGQPEDGQPEDIVPSDDLDDLFPADQPPADQGAEPVDGEDDNLDDLFSQASQPKQRALVSIETTADDRDVRFRLWTDNTGRFQTFGRLVHITRDDVRLLKDNGRFTTVPMHRLSDNDLTYVRRLAKKLRPDLTLFARR